MTLSYLVTLCLFTGVGLLLARFFPVPAPRRTWVLLVVAVVAGGFVGVDTRLLSVFGFAIRLNVAIASCCLGILVGLWARTRKRHAARGAAA